MKIKTAHKAVFKIYGVFTFQKNNELLLGRENIMRKSLVVRLISNRNTSIK